MSFFSRAATHRVISLRVRSHLVWYTLCVFTCILCHILALRTTSHVTSTHAQVACIMLFLTFIHVNFLLCSSILKNPTFSRTPTTLNCAHFCHWCRFCPPCDGMSCRATSKSVAVLLCRSAIVYSSILCAPVPASTFPTTRTTT